MITNFLVRPPRFEPRSSAWQADDGSLLIDSPKIRDNFINFLMSKRFNPRYVKCILSYLDKYVKVITGPNDIFTIFSQLSVGQQHNLSRGVCNIFNFLFKLAFQLHIFFLPNRFIHLHSRLKKLITNKLGGSNPPCNFNAYACRYVNGQSVNDAYKGRSLTY